MRAEIAFSIMGLSKSYNGLKAVDSLSLEVRKGEIYGFLGPNGAGKTTSIKMVLGLTYPDQGKVLIDGMDLSQRPHTIKKRIGFLPERVAFYSNLTALQTLEFYASLKGQAKESLTDLLDSVGLTPFADKKVSTFSKGMVQLLGVAQAMIGNPAHLILDEPTTGLDPNWTRVVKDRIRVANRSGTTVFFSSHKLSEVQELAHRVGIIDRGKLVAQDTVENLGSGLDMKPRIRLSLEVEPDVAERSLASLEGVEEVYTEGNELVVVCDHETKVKVLTHLEGAGISVKDFRTEEPSLEEVFLKLTESSKRSIR
ncbi:MAG: ABC transporter ATP-binding protein [Candidatus Thermoplasmatota archaeon]|nr:ABC transporter ATP-binding protein [Candidatus Thermoplasmatota archaeon]